MIQTSPKRGAIPKKVVLVALCALFTMGSLLLPFLNPEAAFAKNETYTWASRDVIRVSAGNIQGTTDLHAHSDSGVNNGTEAFWGHVTHESGCMLLLNVLVGGTPPEVVEVTENPATPEIDTTCNPVIQNNMVGPIKITNARPAKTSSKVKIRIWSPKALPESPASILITVKGATGAAETAQKQADSNGATNVPPEQQAAFYETDFFLKAGEHTVCVDNTEVLNCAGTVTGDYSSSVCSTLESTCYNFNIPASLADTNRIFNTRPILLDSSSLCSESPADLGWLVCGAITLVADGAQKFDKMVLNLLSIDTKVIFNTDGKNAPSSEAFHKAWGIFRNLAFAILIIIGLIMVLSELLGLELASAYAIRKMAIPLAVAVIIIPATWWLAEFVFSASNDAALALKDLIENPFADMKADASATGNNITLGNLILVLTIPAAIGGVSYLAVLGFMGILTFGLSAVLAAGSAFMLLAARNVVAYLVILMAPVAIICAVFEPFKKLFTLWKTLTITILLSVPAIAVIIALSHVGALIAFVTNAFGIGIIVAIAIFIGGYAMIWTIFKKLDAVAGQLGGVLNAATGKLQKGLSDYRENQIKNRSRLWKQGGLFNEGSFLGKKFNDVGRRVGAADAINATKGGGGYVGAFVGRNRRALMSTYDNVIRDQKENDPMMKALANNDDANAVLAGSGGINTQQALARSAANAGLSGHRAAAAISGAQAMGVNRANAMTALRTTLKNKARGVSAGNVRFMDQAVRSLSSNESEYQGLAQESAFFARSNGRADLGGTDWISYATSGPNAAAPWQQARQLVQAEQQRRRDTGAPLMDAPQQENLMWQSLSDSTMLNGVERLGTQAMVAGHDNQVVQVMQTLSRVLETSTDPQDRLQAAVAIKEIQGNMPAGASGGVRDVINQMLYNPRTVDPAHPERSAGLGLNASGNIAQQLAVRAGLDGKDGATAGQTLTTLGRTYGEYTGAEEAARRAGGGTP